jgi:hypothetical protein
MFPIEMKGKKKSCDRLYERDSKDAIPPRYSDAMGMVI